jgi:acyl-CoA thioesterase FadM
MGTMVTFQFMTTISQEMLDELGHANYNKLKDGFENARHRLCKFLGFGRKTLRTQLGIALVVLKDSYKYHKPLKQHEVIHLFFTQIVITGPSTITIHLRFGRWDSNPELTNEAIYEMALVNLKTNKPIRLPQAIKRQIARFEDQQKRLWQPVPEPPSSNFNLYSDTTTPV